MRGGARPTYTTSTLGAELAEARFDRLLLRVTDTPGLDVRPGRELVLERQLGALISGLEQRFKEEAPILRIGIQEYGPCREDHIDSIHVLGPEFLSTYVPQSLTSA